MLESNTNFALFVLVLSLLLVLSIFPIYPRFTHPLGNSDLLQTSVYFAFHLSALSHTVNALSRTLLQHSGTHFQKTSDFLSQFLPLDQRLRPTFFQNKDIVLIECVLMCLCACVRACMCVCVCLVSRLHVIGCDCCLCIVYCIYNCKPR